MDRKIYEMPFAEFYAAAKPTSAVNRFPGASGETPVCSYQVHLNGNITDELDEGSKNFDFKDVMVIELTKKLGLDPEYFRDNLKVCELVACRSTWMNEAAKAGVMHPLPYDVMTDYDQLLKGMTHPFIQNEIKNQKSRTHGLSSVLDGISMQYGRTVKDFAPDEVSVGRIVKSGSDFTIQQTTNGEVVTHDNLYLEGKIPKEGSNVTISYYRGNGQVVDSLENMKISTPFVDKKSGDLAINLVDQQGYEQVILFNSLSSVDKFVKAHGLDNALVGMAVDARVATPKVVVPKPSREVVSDVYVETESNCLAIDYMEKGVIFSALFTSSAAMEAAAKDFGLSKKEINEAKKLETNGLVKTEATISPLKSDVIADVARLGLAKAIEPVEGRFYSGKIVAEQGPFVAMLSAGGRETVILDLRSLDKVLLTGDICTVKVEQGRGEVSDLARDRNSSVER